MSQRNSQQAKANARERLRAERERQAKKDARKRQFLVAGGVVAVLAIGAGIAVAVAQGNKPSQWESAKSDTLVKPKNTSGENGTTVVIGKESAKKTLTLFEDPRCPICSQFEQTVGPDLHADLDAGKFKVEYVGATFLDGDSGSASKIDLGSRGSGSKNAMSALGAALNVSPDAFLDYKTAMYAKKWHPDETDDKLNSDSYLLKIAATVPALKDNATFEKQVKDGTYDRWAIEMSKNFNKQSDKYGVTGTPSLVMDGKKVVGSDGQNAPMTAEDYKTAIAAALKG